MRLSSPVVPFAPLTSVATLTLPSPPAPGEMPLASSASGILVGPSGATVVPDDLPISVQLRPTATGWSASAAAGFPGPPNPDPVKRRKEKADLESIFRLPVSATFPNGAVVALGSGSKAGRERALLWRASEAAATTPDVVDLAPLYGVLRSTLGEQLNLEGATVRGDSVLLFHRGNEKTSRGSAVLTMGRSAFEAAVAGTLSAPPTVGVQRVELGALDGARLSFSDARALDDGRIVFTASAERTDSSTGDGPIAGSVIGVLDAKLAVTKVMRTREPLKIEGVDLVGSGADARLLLVTDADDPTKASQVLSMPASALTG
jgi:hypothetical protein